MKELRKELRKVEEALANARNDHKYVSPWNMHAFDARRDWLKRRREELLNLLANTIVVTCPWSTAT